MKLPRWIEPRDLIAAAITVTGWTVMVAVWVTTTRSDLNALGATVATHGTTLDTHTRQLTDNANWHTALAAHADSDSRALRDHDARIRALEERLAKIDIVANDVSWIKDYLKTERERNR